MIPELMDFGRKNVAKYGFIKRGTVEFHSFNATKGMLEEAPFDRIISSGFGARFARSVERTVENRRKNCCADKRRHSFVCQKGENEFEENIYPGFAFVLLISLSE